MAATRVAFKIQVYKLEFGGRDHSSLLIFGARAPGPGRVHGCTVTGMSDSDNLPDSLPA